MTVLDDPLHTFSILEPGGVGGCAGGDHRTKVSQTSGQYNCNVAGNGGFFDITTGACLGNIVSRGRIIQNTGLQNANFGIRRDGTIVVGYLDKSDIDNSSNPFQNLVAGVIWLVRGGKNYVNESQGLEYMGIQTTGSSFVTVKSARSALGHDSQGRLVLVQVDGKSWERGVDLFELADFLVSRGVVNAINLDGGGSMTSVMGGNVLVNMPSDSCPTDKSLFCERQVTTIVCFHQFLCITNDNCGLNQSCVEGKCISTFSEEDKRSPCNSSCVHGICNNQTGTCTCELGWTGVDCSLDFCSSPCLHGWYNLKNRTCECQAGWSDPTCGTFACDPPCVNGTCHERIGICICDGGYTGDRCHLNACELVL
eukprot:TRINITY_DN6956_c0_g1_i3.p1 TRINITY_DN6956_c0_g1~~TRINITY_DN6956_c0_g1_i3.p1  ORF type:complete len:367 (-),score=60.05 TRINITY_DN6956_c0_g1_i3:112-1212(-)